MQGRRFELVWGCLLSAVFQAGGCGAESAEAPKDCLVGQPPVDPEGGDAHAEQRKRCEFLSGAMPEASVTGDVQGLRDRVRHVFVLMLENRSFDHYFSRLSVEGQTVDVAR